MTLVVRQQPYLEHAEGLNPSLTWPLWIQSYCLPVECQRNKYDLFVPRQASFVVPVIPYFFILLQVC
jgi:hypothetical protein